jgi:tyrosinase
LGPKPDVLGVRTLIGGQQDCSSESVYNLAPLEDVSKRPVGFMNGMIQPTQMAIMDGQLCLDAQNYDSADETFYASACSPLAASQKWFFWLGQIRNIETGLCLDSFSYGEVSKLKLGSCNPQNIYSSTTLGWVKTPDNIIKNVDSENCIRFVKDAATDKVAFMVGTGNCGDRDELSAHPNKFTSSVNNFFTRVPASATASATGNTCTSQIVRKDIRDLTAAQQAEVFAAITRLHHIPSFMGRVNLFHDIVFVHHISSAIIHDSPAFLPWHRYYIAFFESLLQQVSGNKNLAMYYWSWGVDNERWFDVKTGVLTPSLLGTTGQGDESLCVKDGFMNGTWIPTDNRGCLIRDYNPNPENLEAMDTGYPETLMLMLTILNSGTNKPYKSYDEFRQTLEIPHNKMHQTLAGDTNMPHLVRTAVSVNDPIFFAHHVNVDRYYAIFQKLNKVRGLGEAYDGVMTFNTYLESPVNVSKSDMLTGFNVPAIQGVRLGPCIQYQPYSKSVAAITTSIVKNIVQIIQNALTQLNDAFNTPKIATRAASTGGLKGSRKAPSPLSENFLQLNKDMMPRMTVEKVRASEAKLSQLHGMLKSKTDEVLKAQFGTTFEKATFEQYASAVKVALASFM